MTSDFSQYYTRILTVGLITLMGVGLVYAKPGIPDDTVGPDTTLSPTKIVMVAPADRRELFESVNRAVESQLSDLYVTFSIHWVPSLASSLSDQETIAEKAALETRATIVFWIDLSHEEKTYLYISVPQMKRVVVRRLDDSAPGARLETLAIIVRSSVLSTLRLGKWADSEELAKNKKKTREKQRTETQSEIKARYHEDIYSRPGSRFAIRGAWAVDVISTQNPFENGADLGIALRFGRHWHVHAGYLLGGSIENSLDGVRMKLLRHPISTGIRFNYIVGHVEFGARVDATVDVATTKVEIDSDSNFSMDEQAEDAEVEFSLSPQFHLGIRLADRVVCFLALGVEFPLTSMKYIVEKDVSGTEGQHQTMISSWPVRPISRLGLSIGLI